MYPFSILIDEHAPLKFLVRKLKKAEENNKNIFTYKHIIIFQQ